MLQHVIAVKDDVINGNARLMAEAQQLERISVERMSNVRAFLLTGDSTARQAVTLMRENFFGLLKDMQVRVGDPEEKQSLAQLAADATDQFDAGDSVVAMREKNVAEVAELGRVFQDRWCLEPARCGATCPTSSGWSSAASRPLPPVPGRWPRTPFC